MEKVKFTPMERLVEIPLKLIWYFIEALVWCVRNPIYPAIALIAWLVLT